MQKDSKLMFMRKSSAKSSAGVLVIQPHGGALSAGNPGNSGGGRKPDEWKARLRQIVSSDAVLDALQSVLDSPSHPAYNGALKFAAAYGYGLPPQSHEVTGKDGGPIRVEQVWEFGTRKVGF